MTLIYAMDSIYNPADQVGLKFFRDGSAQGLINPTGGRVISAYSVNGKSLSITTDTKGGVNLADHPTGIYLLNSPSGQNARVNTRRAGQKK